MKLLAVRNARAIWLVPTIFLNPRGRFIFPAIEALGHRYNFTTVPDRAALLAQPLELRFEGGMFTGNTDIPIVISLSIHDDGLVVDSRSSTEDCDAFLYDALSWLETEYGGPSLSDLSIRKIYVSELYVQIDEPLDIFSKRFLPFINRLNEGLNNDAKKPFGLISLNFGADPATTKQLNPFRLERMVETPFSENRYYSAAPTSTTEHLSLLELLHDTIKG